MILVMNKKHGVGCSLLAYNLGKLFNLNIYVNKDNYMIDDEHSLLFPEVKKLTPNIKNGIIDIGANIETTYSRKFIKQAKLIVVPFEFGYESIMKTISTLKYIEYATNRKIPTILVLNRLDRQDSDRDFNYTREMRDRFEEAGFRFKRNIFSPEDEGNFYLTYLRNSYEFQSSMDSGEYFLDKFFNDTYIDKTFDNNNFRKKIKQFDYRFFVNIAKNIIHKVNYRNEDIYIQDKDMVVFRNNYEDYIRKHFYNLERNLVDDLYPYNKLEERIRIDSLIDNSYVRNKETKLVKDFAYISYLVDSLYT